MSLFGRNASIEMLSGLSFTSKAELKRQCMIIYQGNIKDAKEAYEFLVEGLDLPDVDPVRPTTVEQVKDFANTAVNWVGNNQQTLVSIYQSIKDAIAGKVAEVEEAVEVEE